MDRKGRRDKKDKIREVKHASLAAGMSNFTGAAVDLMACECN